MWSRTPHKYKARRTTSSDGLFFASKAEAVCYEILKQKIQNKEIKEVKLQPKVELTNAKIIYKPDFLVIKNNKEILYIECKGYETRDWKIKKKLWKYYGPAPLEIWKIKGTKPICYEIIYPQYLCHELDLKHKE
ncbi:MAG: DUF1064 domain-containing protein [Candidatus Aenigmatarchaeota archaeon]